VTAEPEALALIARLADGGMRDAESLLDQVMAYAGDQVVENSVREAVGLADEEAIAGLLDAYVAGDAVGALQGIAYLSDAGRDLGQVAQQLEAEGRRRLLASPGDPALARRLAAVLRAAAEAGTTGARDGRARLHLELLAIDASAATPARASIPAAIPATIPTAKAEPAAAVRTPAPAPAAAAKPAPTPAPVPVAVAPSPAPPIANGERPTLEVLRARWGEVVERASPVVKPLIKECRPHELNGAHLTLAFPEEREFLRGLIASRARNIEQLLTEMFGGAWSIECVAASVDLEPLTVAEAIAPGDAPDANALLQRTLEITGGQLVDAPEVR
jgi:DNA polymerase-3 subunit gamma/tau